MGFNSVYDIFVIMPISVLLVAIAPRRTKRWLLILIGLVLYAWGDPRHILWLLGALVADWLIGWLISFFSVRGRKRPAWILFWFGVAAHVALLAWLKYFYGEMPLGLSFYTLSAISFFADIVRRENQSHISPVRTFLYLSFFPKLLAGPVVSYAELEPQLKAIAPTREDRAAGAQIFLMGLCKKIILADNLGAACAAMTGSNAGSAVAHWFGMILFGLRLYYDIGGYTDMAVGLARMLGMHLPGNFDYPHRSRTLWGFWQRWHTSLWKWFRKYIYDPMGGDDRDPGQMAFRMIFVFLLIGLWHGCTANYILWGLYSGIALTVDRLLLHRRAQRMSPVLRTVLVNLFVTLGWVFFLAPDLAGAGRYFGGLIGIGAPFMNRGTAFYLGEYLPLLIVSFVGTSAYVRKVFRGIFYRNNLQVRERMLQIIATVGTLVILICALAGLVGNPVTPFFYSAF